MIAVVTVQKWVGRWRHAGLSGGAVVSCCDLFAACQTLISRGAASTARQGRGWLACVAFYWGWFWAPASAPQDFPQNLPRVGPPKFSPKSAPQKLQVDLVVKILGQFLGQVLARAFLGAGQSLLGWRQVRPHEQLLRAGGEISDIPLWHTGLNEARRRRAAANSCA